ncbi:MAG TPA: nucleotidyl transferase AbiEii/AbiGii toxin family protein [Thermoanaerobaculia bacterium]|jgi:hypothetical protein|nr:nucleotidyl transferase AbiEii/AbiGii toxin family protein [Thermoanaerobaculia bacterium]
MPVNPDFKDLFVALNAAAARFLLVGGYALAHHGHPRFTRGLDVWVEPGTDNSRRVYVALEAFGAPLHELRREDLEREGLIFQIGVAPNRIDIITSIDGVVFGEAWEAREQTSYGGEPVPVLGRLHLIANKRESGRPQDLVDLEELEKTGD